MMDHDLPSYLNGAQSVTEDIKRILSEDDLKEVLAKLDKYVYGLCPSRFA